MPIVPAHTQASSEYDLFAFGWIASVELYGSLPSVDSEHPVMIRLTRVDSAHSSIQYIIVLNLLLEYIVVTL